jgi:hypothetical protein
MNFDAWCNERSQIDFVLPAFYHDFFAAVIDVVHALAFVVVDPHVCDFDCKEDENHALLWLQCSVARRSFELLHST